MRRVPLAVRRTLAHSDLYAAIAALILLVAFLLSFATAYLLSSTTAGVCEALESASADDRTARVQVRLDDDAATQAAEFRTLIQSRLPASTTVTRTLQTDPIAGAGTLLVFVAGDAFSVEGDRGSGAAISADDARAYGVDIGDVLTLGDGVPVEVTGTYTRSDPRAAVWAGIEGVPILVDESVLDTLPGTPLVTFTITPDPDRVTAADLSGLVAGLAGLNGAIRDAALAPSGLEESGGLEATAADLESGFLATLEVAPAALALVAIVGVVTMVLVVRLLVAFRHAETVQLRARGASRRWLVRSAVGEMTAVVVPAAIIGSALAGLVTLLLIGPPPLAAIAIPGAATAAVVLLLTGLIARRDARSPVTRGGDATTTRAPDALVTGGVVLLVVATAIAVWQFLGFAHETTAGFDPATALAPALSLVTIAALTLLAFAPVARWREKRLTAGRGIRVFDARQVARRLTVFAAPVLLVALAFGGTAFAAGYSATWGGFSAANAALANGADVRVVGEDAAERIAEVRGADALRSAAPAYSSEATIGDAELTMVALAPDSFAELTGATIPDGPEVTGIAVTAPLSAKLTVDGDAQARVGAWLMSPDGSMVRLALADGRAVNPPDGGPWSLVALDIGAEADSLDTPVTVTVEGLDGLDGWLAQEDVTPVAITGSRIVAAGVLPGTDTRVMSRQSTALAVDAAMTATVAERNGLSIGDVTTVRAGSGVWTFDIVVSSIVDVLPGVSSNNAVAADLRSVEAAVLAGSANPLLPSEVWASSDDAPSTAAALRDVLGPDAVVGTTAEGAGARLVPAASVVLWIGALGALVLSVGAIVFVAVSLSRARSLEVAVLRAVGLTAAEQARGRRWELSFSLLFAAVCGTLGGSLVAVLLASELARSVEGDAPTALAAPVAFDLLPWILALAVAVAGFCLVVTVVGAAVRRAAEDATPVEVSG